MLLYFRYLPNVSTICNIGSTNNSILPADRLLVATNYYACNVLHIPFIVPKTSARVHNDHISLTLPT